MGLASWVLGPIMNAAYRGSIPVQKARHEGGNFFRHVRLQVMLLTRVVFNIVQATSNIPPVLL